MGQALDQNGLALEYLRLLAFNTIRQTINCDAKLLGGLSASWLPFGPSLEKFGLAMDLHTNGGTFRTAKMT